MSKTMPIIKAKMLMIIAFMSVHTACSGIHVHLELASSKSINNTKCVKGLLLKEKFLLIGTITGVEKNLIKGGQIYIKSKNKVNETVESTLKTLDIDECNATSNYTFTCEINIENKEINTKYTESASNKFNNVSLFLGIYYNKSLYNSSTIELPRIYDPEKIKVFLNDQELSKNGNAIIVKNSTLHFRCHDAPEPCELSIYDRQSLVERNQTSLIIYNVDIKKNGYTFRYKVCNSDTIITYSPCLIGEILTCDADSPSKECKNDVLVIVLCVLGVALFLSLAFNIFISWKYRKDSLKWRRFCRDRENQNTDKTQDSENDSLTGQNPDQETALNTNVI